MDSLEGPPEGAIDALEVIAVTCTLGIGQRSVGTLEDADAVEVAEGIFGPIVEGDASRRPCGEGR